MRKFLITSPKYNGAVEVVYNERSTLCIIDAGKTDMSEDVMNHFKKIVPVNMHLLLDGPNMFSADTVICESDFVITFKQFYDNYPLKRNRYKAEKVFEGMNKTEQVKAFYSLHNYKKYMNRNSWYTPMIADKYLRNREYETEWNKV